MRDKKILVVDDDEELLFALKNILEKENFNVELASNAIEAIAKIKKKPDLILLDIMMPDLSGWDVIKVMEEEKIRDIPIIMLTAKPLSEDKLYSREIENIVDYVEKPFNREKLIEKIKKALISFQKIDSIVNILKSFYPELEEEYENLKRGEMLHRNLREILEQHLKKAIDEQERKSLEEAIEYESIVIETYSKRIKEIEKVISELAEKQIKKSD